MKRFFLAYLLITFFNAVCQPPSTGCIQSTTAINTIFYPNTITNVTSTLTNISGMYLCGPNTIVYDTSNVSQGGFSCRSAFVSPSSTLVTNSWACAYYEVYFIKSGGTIVFQSNTNNAGVNVYYEPGAVIIDNSPGVNIYSCSSITFPSVNCTQTGIKENIFSNHIEIYPNPIKDKLNIDFNIIKTENIKLNIFNLLSQIVYSIDKPNTKQEIDLSFLASGIYYLKIQDNSEQKVVKIIKE
jgi:hypothetical protein